VLNAFLILVNYVGHELTRYHQFRIESLRFNARIHESPVSGHNGCQS
jgi:hypothetical protein